MSPLETRREGRRKEVGREAVMKDRKRARRNKKNESVNVIDLLDPINNKG